MATLAESGQGEYAAVCRRREGSRHLANRCRAGFNRQSGLRNYPHDRRRKARKSAAAARVTDRSVRARARRLELMRVVTHQESGFAAPAARSVSAHRRTTCAVIGNR